MSKIFKSFTPYHFYALYNWMIDNGFKPHVYIKNTETTLLPATLQSQEVVLFNIHPDSISTLTVDDDGISFSARFNQKEFTVYSKLQDCLAIIAREIDFAAHYPFIPFVAQAKPEENLVVKSEENLTTLSLIPKTQMAQVSVPQQDAPETIPGRKVKHLTVVK